MFYAMYPYTGYEQPFYVLAEVKHPGRIFAKSVIAAMLLVMVLFPLANVGYLCVVSFGDDGSLPSNIAVAFFQAIARNHNGGGGIASADQAVSIILSLFIFANILAQTFTASRVKQEIAKEAILPWSLQLASGSNSLLSRLSSSSRDRKPAYRDMDNHLEQVPMWATFLHWIFEILLVLLFGIPLKLSASYRALTFLKTFSIVIVFGLLTVLGLAYLKVDSWIRGSRGRKWHTKVAWRPWLDPLPT